MVKLMMNRWVVVWVTALGLAATLPIFYIGTGFRQSKKSELYFPPPHIPKTRFNQFPTEHNEICGQWTYKRYLFPNDEISVQYSMEEGGVALAKWDGLFDIPVRMPYGSDCFNGRPATKSQLSKKATADSILCTFEADASDEYNETNPPKRPRKTVILDIDPERYHWHDVVDDDLLGGINIWHFHAQFFPMWLSIRLADSSISMLKNQNLTTEHGVLQPDTLEPPLDIVILFPTITWERFNRDESETGASKPFLVTTEKLFELRDKRRANPTSVAGLQALMDGIEGSLVVGSHNTTTGELFKVLRESEMEPRGNVWIRPPSRSNFLWLLERYDLEETIGNGCQNSMISDYVRPFINSVPVKYPPKLARHVCFISRQMREHANVPNPKVKSRNLTPDVFLALMKRISSPIVISPHISLRNASADGLPLYLEESSLTGQMRFIHYECAVVVGVHGAGLGHVLGMKPGSHLIEFQAWQNYTIFKNSALLLNNVTYSKFSMNSTIVNKDTNHEADFTIGEEHLEDLIALIHDELDDSIRRQTILTAGLERRR